jgi:hypothetical protein
MIFKGGRGGELCVSERRLDLEREREREREREIKPGVSIAMCTIFF